MAADTPTYMRFTDAFSWNVERDPALRSTVVTVFWLDKAPDWDTLVHRNERGDALDPRLAGTIHQPGHQRGAQSEPLPAVDDRHRDLGDLRVLGVTDVARDAQRRPPGLVTAPMASWSWWSTWVK